MKIKVDHVTNSSSSSFVVIGMYIKGDMISNERITSIVEKYPDIKFEDLRKKIHIYMDELIEGTQLEYSFGPEGCWGSPDGVYVGIGYSNMQEDETLKQFKERVSENLKKIIDSDIKAHHIELAWEDR